MQKKLTIITISFKSPSDLRLTYNSINSHDADVEWLIVDGGGCEDSLKFLKQLPPTVNWVSERDNGIYDAMRKGVKMATGQHILFLNSGDELLDWSILKNTLLEAQNVDVLYAAAKFSNKGSDIFIRYPRKPHIYIFHSVPGNQQATIYKRSALIRVGIPIEYPLCGDYALACSLFRGDFLIHRSRNVLSRFYLGGASSVRWGQLLFEAWRIQQKILHSNIILRSLSFGFRALNIFSLKILKVSKPVFVYAFSRAK